VSLCGGRHTCGQQIILVIDVWVTDHNINPNPNPTDPNPNVTQMSVAF